MMMFTEEELNAIGLMVSNAPIAGKDAKFVSNLLDKVAAMLAERQETKVADVEVT